MVLLPTVVYICVPESDAFGAVLFRLSRSSDVSKARYIAHILQDVPFGYKTFALGGLLPPSRVL